MSEDVNEEEERKSDYTLDQFKEVVNIAKHLIDSRGIIVKVSSSLGVTLTVDKAALEEKLKAASVDAETFGRILKPGVAYMISALLSEKQDIYRDSLLEDVKEEEREEKKKSIEERLEVVKNVIIDKTVKDKYWVKATSKVDFFEDMSWEINEKQEISEKPYSEDQGLESLAYATIRLEFKRNPIYRAYGAFGFFTFTPFFPFANEEPFSAIFDCDVSQIDDFIGVLRDIRQKLKEREEKK